MSFRVYKFYRFKMWIEKMLKKRVLLILPVFIAVTFLGLNAIFDLKSLGGTSGRSEFVFATSADAKRKQLEDLEKYLEQFRKKVEESSKSVASSLSNIKSDVSQAEEKLKAALEQEKEFLTKKVGLLKDRQQNLSRLQELWAGTEQIINKNIQQTKEMAEKLQQPATEEDIKGRYYWKEFDQIQDKILEYLEKIDLEKTKKDSFIKQQDAEKSNLAYFYKQVEEKKKEREELGKKKGETEEERERLVEQDELLGLEISFLNEKINYSNFKIENWEQEIKAKENEIELLQYQLNKTRVLLDIIEARLIITSEDVKDLKSEFDKESQRAVKEKEQLSRQREFKKREKEKLGFILESLREEVKEAKESGDEISAYLTESKLKKAESSYSLLEKELALLDLKVDLENVLVISKELRYQKCDLYHKLALDQAALGTWLSNLKEQRDRTIRSIKLARDNRKEGEDFSVEIRRKIDALKEKEEELKKKRETPFKNQGKALTDVSNNFLETSRNYEKQLQVIQEYLGVSSDLVNKLEKTSKQYAFIIERVEAKEISLNIWKRSPKAISFDGFIKSLADAESFFRDLFWDTPLYLSPISLINSIKHFDYYGYLSLFLLLLLFVVSFIVIKILLKLLLNKIKNSVSFYHDKKNFLYFLLTAESLIEFTLNNFKVLFAWLFIYLHVFFEFRHIFSLMRVVANSYSIAIFYLVSIPILIYLSTQLVLSLKVLNQKLSFWFFTEKSQSKFLFLITSILYATSILIPLRRAFLWYSDIPSEFPNVILAAYSLILVVAILLFFGKEDVLILLPTKTKFFIWLRSWVEKYYYPAFIFFMGLLFLSNPYIGYSNLAWYLAFAVPASAFLVYGMFVVHFYIRKYSISFFLKEEDEEIIDKFDYAKTYYGLFVIITFLILLFFNFILVSRIWRFTYTTTSLWNALSQDWVLIIGTDAKGIDVKFGIIQLLTLVLFIGVGFLISSLSHKFVFNKLFDIFRTEPGTQNTIFRISHYLIISVSVLLGLANIQLGQFLFWAVTTFLAVGLGFALKDIVTDFVAGFFVLIERPIEIGNYIQLDEKTRGTVHKISPRATTIRTARNFSVIVPNKDLITKQIINWGQGRLAVGFEVTLLVAYRSDPQVVKQILANVISNHPLILKVPTFTIRLEDFCENGLQFFARAFISSRRVRDQWDVSSDLRFELLKEFAKNNIEIPFPQTVVHFSKDNGNLKPVKGIEIKFDQQ